MIQNWKLETENWKLFCNPGHILFSVRWLNNSFQFRATSYQFYPKKPLNFSFDAA